MRTAPSSSTAELCRETLYQRKSQTGTGDVAIGTRYAYEVWSSIKHHMNFDVVAHISNSSTQQEAESHLLLHKVFEA